MTLRAACWLTFGILSAAFLVAPLALVVAFSFGENPHATLPFGNPTLQWYRELFAGDDFLAALQNSAIVTSCVGLLSAVLGTAAAFGFTALDRKLSRLGAQLISLPVMLPPLVLALALATAFSATRIPLGLGTVIPSHLIFTQPFVILIIYARLTAFDRSLIDSARDLGASSLQIFFTITLPLIAPSLIGATLLSMAISLDDFVITFFTIGGGMTLPTLIWGMLRTHLDPTINALGTLVLVLTLGLSVIAFKLTRYKG
ncbi:ABC transporter permease [Hyphomicrobium facile]|uniref:Spermidine/putrescine transport system permease protein n=1 Tax=Hyphomicrobium facile TaxID=51670 RepID=A0A1I7NJY2_9HYPH|nr:ABC transporter permease [Hyphomicrobium facile]SFV34995.1 spermidine/putrescine transport system permease protein [Hyphomicrobium facile]